VLTSWQSNRVTEHAAESAEWLFEDEFEQPIVAIHAAASQRAQPVSALGDSA